MTQTLLEMLESGDITQDEINLVTAPINTIRETIVFAFSIRDKVADYIYKKNKLFVPSYDPKSAPYQISDYIKDDYLRSMADGKIYDSKSKYYKSLKDQGMVIVDEPPKPSKPKFVDWEKALVETCNKVGI